MAQRRYVMRYCVRLEAALAEEQDGEHVIDMDAVADAAGKDGEKRPFYYAEESQQKRFDCPACGAFNDIIGKFCYCASCGTRNGICELETTTLASLRTRANSGGGYEACISDTVGAFDTFVAQYVRQLVRRVPLRSARKARLERMRFHNLQAVATEIRAGFDIDILENLKPDDTEFATLMFHRRHIHEHNGSVVDEKYLADSGDKSVRLGQAVRETQASAHKLISLDGGEPTPGFSRHPSSRSRADSALRRKQEIENTSLQGRCHLSGTPIEMSLGTYSRRGGQSGVR